MDTRKPGKSILAKSISVLVILISLALLIFMWVIQDDISSSAITVFGEIDNIAQFMRNGLALVNTELENLIDLISKVETASEEIAQDVNEEGVFLRLLPQTISDTLSYSTETLKDSFISVYDLLETTSNVLLALDDIPFVEIPKNGLTTIENLQENMEEIADLVTSLQTDIDEAREQTASKITQVTTAANTLGTKADQLHTDLVQIDTDLDAIQIKVRKYQRAVGTVIVITAAIITLFFGWVVYSQVIMVVEPRRSSDSDTQDNPDKSSPSIGEGNQT